MLGMDDLIFIYTVGKVWAYQIIVGDGWTCQMSEVFKELSEVFANLSKVFGFLSEVLPEMSEPQNQKSERSVKVVRTDPYFVRTSRLPHL